MSKRKNKVQELCAYCGNRLATELEHVIPQTLYDGVEQREYITIPTCRECNVAKSKYDGDLRTIVKIGKEVENHPLTEFGQDKISRSLVRSITENRGNFLRRAEIYFYPKFDENNQNVDFEVQIVYDKKELTPIFKWVVRGLFYYVKKIRIPESISIKVKKLETTEEKELFTNGFKSQPETIGPKYFNDDVFMYMAYFDKSNPTRSGWLLTFFGQSTFLVLTRPVFRTNGYTRKPKNKI